MLTVLLADDSDVMRRSIKRHLVDCPEIRIVGEATTYAETIRFVNELLPDVVLLDVYMPDMYLPDSEEIRVEEVKQACYKSRVLLMSVHATQEVAEFAEKLGVEVFLDKIKLFDELIPAIIQSRSSISSKQNSPGWEG